MVIIRYILALSEQWIPRALSSSWHRQCSMADRFPILSTMIKIALTTIDATKTLLCAFVLSKRDYCNSLLSGSPKHLLDKLQKVQNSAARLVFKAGEHEHIKRTLRQKLHWLPIVSRIQYKVATLCYNSFTGSYPVYLSELRTVYHPSRQLHSISDTRTFRIPSTKQRPLDNELFLSRARHSGTCYHMMFVTQYQHLLSSKP